MYFSATLLRLYQLVASIGLSDPADSACSLLAAALPGSVGVRGSTQYDQDNAHWTGSSSQPSRCTVQPHTPADVATIFNVISKTRTPWAVKGGGHAYNPGYSSTPGVLVSLKKFNDTTYNPLTSTAHIGTGLVWDDVYTRLVKQGVNVVGARVPGIGVGFALGGGYGWNSQEYGLTIDTVTEFNLVTPTGNILNVTEASNPDLFFGLRGGGNNFGIVTGLTLKTHPQTDVFGGPIIYLGDLPAVARAIANFDANNRDPKATILASYTFLDFSFEIVVFLFYDGPSPPKGTFDEFLDIPNVDDNVRRRSFPDFIQSLNLSPKPQRAVAHTVPIVQYTKPIIDKIISETWELGLKTVSAGLGSFATLSIESFIRNIYDNSTGGAYPHSPAHPWTPFQILVVYKDPKKDGALRNDVIETANAIQQLAIKEGQSSPDAILYNNYAMEGTPLDLLYGPNLPRLQQLKAQYDPQNILSLTGGWRF